MIRDQSLFMAWRAGGEGGKGGVEEDQRRILGGSHGFQGKRKGGPVIANRIESED